MCIHIQQQYTGRAPHHHLESFFGNVLNGADLSTKKCFLAHTTPQTRSGTHITGDVNSKMNGGDLQALQAIITGSNQQTATSVHDARFFLAGFKPIFWDISIISWKVEGRLTLTNSYIILNNQFSIYMSIPTTLIKLIDFCMYSPRFAWGGRPHRKFMSVRERG